VTRGVAEQGAPHPRGRAGLGEQGARGAGRVRGGSSRRRALGVPVARRRRRMWRAKGKWVPDTSWEVRARAQGPGGAARQTAGLGPAVHPGHQGRGWRAPRPGEGR
jgi:hypothetical protein